MAVRGTLANQKAAVEADRYFLALVFFFHFVKGFYQNQSCKKQFQVKSILMVFKIMHLYDSFVVVFNQGS